MPKMKYEQFPKIFNKHVVFDTRTGTSYHVDSVSARGAIMTHIQSLGFEEFQRLDQEVHDELGEAASEELLRIMGLNPVDTGSSFSVLAIGPFETVNADQQGKNIQYCLSRFAQLISGEAFNPDDAKAAEWVKNKLATSTEKAREREDAKQMDMMAVMEKILGGAFKL